MIFLCLSVANAMDLRDDVDKLEELSKKVPHSVVDDLMGDSEAAPDPPECMFEEFDHYFDLFEGDAADFEMSLF